ncbi:hypothetical protein [Lacticaseibacillus porcinae]|uniref:hypothetical protein n=1 Tax=Lacticaseibacillus porcinae TaxID=1123687 RepID=UPI001CDD7261|nr:hypothetical protein [Lacticaseibacillus porcinae]
MADHSRFTSVYVKRPGNLWEKHIKYDFGIVIRYVGHTPGFDQARFDVWIPDTNTIRSAFITDIRKYPIRRKKA